MERIDETRRVLITEVSDRPRLGWMDGVKVALGSRGMMEVAQKLGRSGEPWWMIGFHAIFA